MNFQRGLSTFLLLSLVWVAGCGGSASDTAPKAPEPTSADYQRYSGGGRGNPNAAPGAPGGGPAGGHGGASRPSGGPGGSHGGR